MGDRRNPCDRRSGGCYGVEVQHPRAFAVAVRASGSVVRTGVSIGEVRRPPVVARLHDAVEHGAGSAARGARVRLSGCGRWDRLAQPPRHAPPAPSRRAAPAPRTPHPRNTGRRTQQNNHNIPSIIRCTHSSSNSIDTGDFPELISHHNIISPFS